MNFNNFVTYIRSKCKSVIFYCKLYVDQRVYIHLVDLIKIILKQYFIFLAFMYGNMLPDHYYNSNVIETFKLTQTKADFSLF